MVARKTGSYHPCKVCGTPVWRTPSAVRRNIRQTCSKACLSEMMSGPGNPFWGKVHDEATRQKIREGRRANPPKKTGPPKGYKHSPEARAKISEALRQRWRDNRDSMLAHNPPKLTPREDQRYRRNFTPLQRREWKDNKCAWCNETDDLTLDHIIPVMAGGTNRRSNAQTLCRLCNLWKMKHVDRPFYLATLGSKGGQS